MARFWGAMSGPVGAEWAWGGGPGHQYCIFLWCLLLAFYREQKRFSIWPEESGVRLYVKLLLSL